MGALWPLALVLLAQVGGDTPEAEALRRRLAQDRVKMRFLRNEEASILAGFEALDRKLADQRGKLAASVDQIRRLESQIGELDARLLGSEAELTRLRERAGQRASAMQRLRRTRLSDLYRQARAPAELRRLKDRLRLVLAFDAKLIKDVREETDTARALRVDLKQSRDRLAEEQSALADQAEETAVLREERAALLEGIKSERSASERLAGELVAAASKLEKELSVVRGDRPAPDPLPGGFAAQRGRLPWPVAGRVEVPFGKTVDPGSGMVMVQKGLDIRAPIASEVRAVFGGAVVFAAWFEGFGRLIIVEHDGGYYSLYAHLETFLVKKGQAVAQHQVLGLVGDSGSTKGAYLYLELREGRDPIDPMRWLAP